MKKSGNTKSEKKLVYGAIITFLLAVAVFSSIKLTKVDAMNGKEYAKYKYYTSYQVQPGDTLTAIAQEHICLLYTSTNVNRAWSINKITQDLEKELKPSRYTHTLNVAKTAKNMAEAFNVNPNKAYFAGILHDCAKNFSDQKLLQICKRCV